MIKHLSTNALAQRFWKDVDVRGPSECWSWVGCTTPKGYGQLTFGSQHYYAHRVAWTLTYGTIPKGIRVLHHCDSPSCCNPAHLFSGTDADNQADMTKKGRGRFGGRNGRSVLTADLVSEIRHRYAMGGVSQDTLAREYSIGQTAISRLIRRVTWKHV